MVIFCGVELQVCTAHQVVVVPGEVCVEAAVGLVLKEEVLNETCNLKNSYNVAPLPD